MVFYHGTTKTAWQTIQDEGVLWGIRKMPEGSPFNPDRCTYLAVEKADAMGWIPEDEEEVILEVEYDPKAPGVGIRNNWIPGCWQVRVYEPIPIANIREKRSPESRSK